MGTPHNQPRLLCLQATSFSISSTTAYLVTCVVTLYSGENCYLLQSLNIPTTISSKTGPTMNTGLSSACVQLPSANLLLLSKHRQYFFQIDQANRRREIQHFGGQEGGGGQVEVRTAAKRFLCATTKKITARSKNSPPQCNSNPK